MRLAYALILLIALAPGLAAADSGSAINRAGEQRMLSQRIVKSYCQIGLDVMPAEAGDQLQQSIARFEANLVALREISARTAGAADAYASLSETWKPFRANALSPPARDSTLALAQQSEAVLAAAERLTRALEDAAGNTVGRAINLAGRQRMLSQRVAKAYMLRAWGVDSNALREEMETAANEFVGGLGALAARAENTDEIRHEIEDLALQWEWLQAAVSMEGVTSYRLVVAEAAEGILAAAYRLTALYDQIAAK